MISFIKGIIEQKAENSVTVEVNGMGLDVFMPTTDIASIGEIGEYVKINTYFQIRDEQPELYGFSTKDELHFFNKLIAVSGVGPKAALAILSTLAPRDLSLAIVCDDVKAITRAPGVGTKIAQRIILELKGKIDTQEAVEIQSNTGVKQNTLRADTEAVNALIALGASPSEAQKTVMRMDTSNLSTEDIIKEALRRMANGI
ncbi:MAG: Holliday junction branch migration protein RuvA [Clostridia bacterium]|nr:Holliday junction branch migration protein RuvA [Clostridia bacterium]